MPRASKKNDTADQSSDNGKATATKTRSRKTQVARTKAKSASTSEGKTAKPRATRSKAAAKEPTVADRLQPITEEISLAGSQLVDKFKELIGEGNVRRVVIKHEGNVMLEVPLTAAIVGGALAVWAAPVIAAVTAIAGTVANVTLEVKRATPAAKGKSGKSK
ncbi:MAG: DUF4342 domain-containing protein [Anaerolineae bacterium]|nr:DUF4342 domain-containing protein [Anaerolineae bacterium]